VKNITRIATALLALLVLSCNPKIVIWEKTLDFGGDEVATALASDGSAFYVSFIATKAGAPDRAGWVVTKLDSTGKQLWTQMYKDASYATCQDIWADRQGNVFAAGRVKSKTEQACLVMRYSTAGAVTWQKGLRVGDKTWGSGVCPVSGDRIAVCGTAGTDANTDEMVALLDAKDGRTIWVKNIDLCANDQAARIACDAKDNLAVIGLYSQTAANPDLVIVKLKPNGDTLWTRRYDSGGADEPGDVAFDQFGNIIATGTAKIGDSTRCVIVEYDPNGDLIRKLAYGTVAQATGKGIFVTDEANIFMTGALLRTDGKSEILAFEYKPTAVAVWEQHYTPGPSAGGVDLVVNGVYVAATMQGKTKDVFVCRFARIAAGGNGGK
jgi:hypothetical protein